MNYLAHLFLAEDHPDAKLGSLMGDFVKGPIADNYSPIMRRAIVEHRRIDSFTDQHPIVTECRARLDTRFRRYGGILIDMFFDHCLARQWEHYSSEPLTDFARRMYQTVEEHRHPLPGRMPIAMHYMIKYDSLVHYGTTEGIHRALQGIATRLKRPSALGDGINELTERPTEWQQAFHAFMPELIAVVQNARESIDADAL